MSVTPLTTYRSTQADSLLITADKLYSTVGTPTTGNVDNLVGLATGYGELYSQGNAGAWAALSAIGAPSGHGWLFNVSTLQGRQFVAGAWADTLHLILAFGGATPSITADLYVRAFKYTLNGLYIPVTVMSTTGRTIDSTSRSFISTVTTALATSFVPGDKLYIDAWPNILTNANAQSGLKIRMNHLSTDTAGQTGDALEQTVTPGHQATPALVFDANPYGATIQAGGSNLNPARVTDMVNMGIHWLRFQLNWSGIESVQTTPPTYDWSILDNAVSQCNAVGISFVFCIQQPPTWHAYGGGGGNPGFLCDSKSWALPADQAVFAAAVAHRYTVGDPANPAAYHIESEECANEGYDDGSLDSCKDGFWPVPLQQATYSAVKGVNANILVGAPAQLKIEKGHVATWIQDFYSPPDHSVGGGGFVDYHQAHFYEGQRGPNTDDGVHVTFVQYYQAIFSAAQAAGFPCRVWFTETGFPQANLDGTIGPCNVNSLGQPQSGYAQQGCLLQETLDAGREGGAAGFELKVFVYTLALGDGYSPVHGVSPEVFEAGYYLYAGGSAQYPIGYSVLHPTWPKVPLVSGGHHRGGRYGRNRH